MCKASGIGVACFVLAMAALSPRATANTDQLVLYNQRYPTTIGQANQGSNCLVCHTSGSTRNVYGTAFKNSPAGPDSINGLAQIEFLDSDGDNFTNLHEILLFSFPGNPAQFPANANAAPVLNAIGNKSLNEGQTLTFQVTTTDEVNGLNPLLSAVNLPPGATFTDNRNRTGTFTWVTDFADGGVYTGVQFVSSDGLLQDTETITITVNDTNLAPEMDFLESQLIYVDTLFELTVSGSDPENAPVTLSVQGLPLGADFQDNGDGTATLSWVPGEDDIGIYPGVTFTVEDDAAQTASVTIALFVMPALILNFAPETPLNNTHLDDEVIEYAPDLATDGNGNWVAVWYVSDTGILTVARSTDNGETWTDPAALSPLNGTDEAPQIATDGEGNWVVVWRSSNNLGGTIGNDLDILYARSTDNGETWSPAASLNPDAALDSEDHRGANIEYAGGVWIASWLEETDLYITRSTDAGSTWGAPEFIGTAFLELFPDPAAARLAGDGSGNWIVVWTKGTQFGGLGNDLDVQVSRSADGGVTWSSPIALNNDAASDNGDDQFPSITTDGAGNWLCVWRGTKWLGGPTGTDAEVIVARSVDNGATWTNPAPLALDAEFDGFVWDYAPSVTTDGRGTWVAIWYTANAEIRMSYSTDAGVTWSFPTVLNATSDDTTRYPHAFGDGKGNWLAVWETNENPLDVGFDFDLMIARAYAPNVQSITRVGNQLTNAAQVAFTVAFDGDVFGVDTGDFAVSSSKILTGASVSNVTANNPGEYTVTVNTGTGTGTLSLEFVDDDTVFNNAGNVAGGPGEGNGDLQSQQSYTVDKTKPVITRIGSETVTVPVGEQYEDAGATAVDDLDGNLTLSIAVDSNVNTLTPGNYTVRYNVSDSAGNAANEVTRAVNVLASIEGEGEGGVDGEGTPDGEGAQDGEGSPDGEGAIDGEGSVDGEGSSEGEGAVDGEGSADGEGNADGEGEGEGEGMPVESHSADQDGNQRISLTELLRLVQLYNLIEYGCDLNGEDGYSALSVDQNCLPHTSDFDPQDWIISLRELLRLIQFYNANGYLPCLEGEDGYCPAT